MSVSEIPDADVQEPQPPSVLADLASVLEDHLNLAALEAGYEFDQAGRRFLFIGLAALLGVCAFLLAQVAIVDGLVALFKWPVWAVCLILTAVYGTAAALIVRRYGLRDPRAGAPFAGTRRELIGTLQWIQKLFL